MSAGEQASGDGVAKRLFKYIDMKINPVLLRDLRLYGRGKSMIWTYFFVLVILVLGGIAYTLAARWGGLDGRKLIYVPTMLLPFIVGAGIPNLVGERFRSELASRATELALVSPLTPARLVRGKVFGAWCLTLQALSLAVPVFATAYLLGGVTALDILALAGGILLAGVVMPMPQMYLATKARMQRSGGRILFAMALVGNAILMYMYSFFLYETFIGDPYEIAMYRAFLAALTVAGLLYAQFLYFVTVSRLRGVAENRELAPRLSLSFGLVAGGAAAFAIVKALSRYGVVGGRRETAGFMVAAVLILAFAFCLGMTLLCEGNTDAPRLPADAPRRGILARLFFANGASSLAAYFLVNSLGVIGVGLFALAVVESRHASDIWHMITIMLSPFMAMAYGMVAYFYFVRPLRKEPPTPSLLVSTIVVTNIILLIAAIFIAIIGSGSDDFFELRPYVFGCTPAGLVMGTFERSSQVPSVALCGLAVLAVLFLALTPMALRSLWRRRDAA